MAFRGIVLLGAGVVGEVRVFAWGLQLFSGFSLDFLAVLRAYVRLHFVRRARFAWGSSLFEGLWSVRCVFFCAGCSFSLGSLWVFSGFRALRLGLPISVL